MGVGEGGREGGREWMWVEGRESGSGCGWKGGKAGVGEGGREGEREWVRVEGREGRSG